MIDESSWPEATKQLGPQQRKMFETLQDWGAGLIEDIRRSDLPHEVQGALVALFAYMCMGYMATRSCENVVDMIKEDRGEVRG